MKLSNILIPFESSEFGLRERDMGIYRDLYSIQVIEHNFYKLPKKGYILVNNTNPKFPYDVKFKFFIYGGEVNQSINTGMLIEENQFKAWFSKNSQNPLFLEMIGHAMYSTKSNLYNNDVKVSFKYFIDILELSGCIGDPNKFKLSSYNEFNTNYTKPNDYIGTSSIENCVFGFGETLQSLASKYRKNITKTVYMEFLMSQGIHFLINRITGIKTTVCGNICNGGVGGPSNSVYLYDNRFIQEDEVYLNSIYEHLKLMKYINC